LTARSFTIAGLALCVAACTTGQGEGSVRSDRLYVENCWNGAFDLKPEFFGANPFRDEAILIRIQRDDDIQEVSDGVTVLVNDPALIRGNGDDPGLLGQDISVGLPPGVSPPGVPVGDRGAAPLVSLSLYLHDTCHVQNGTLYSIGGSINFTSLFSGDINEAAADDRLTEADFSATFADPRDLLEGTDAAADPNVVSLVEGNFRFFFQRGQPAQPFP
jgi:hypothetical protein